MWRRILIVFLAASLAQADSSIVFKHKGAVVYGSADLLSETYDGSNTCYTGCAGSLTNCSSASSGTCEIDSGNVYTTNSVANNGTTGFTGGHHLLATHNGVNANCDLSYTISTTSQIWARIWFNVNAQTLASGQLQGLIGVFGTGDSLKVGIYNNSGTFQIAARESTLGTTTGITISTGTNYRLEVRWQDNGSTDQIEYRVYDTSGSQIAGSPVLPASGAYFSAGAAHIYIGDTNAFGTATGTSTIYIDNVCVSSQNWCGP